MHSGQYGMDENQHVFILIERGGGRGGVSVIIKTNKERNYKKIK